MVERLRLIAAETPRVNFYLGEGSAQRVRNRAMALGPDASAVERWNALRKVAFHEQRLGNTEAAIEAHQAACALERLEGEELPAAADDTRVELGVSFLRAGEQANCVARHTSRSCIFPIEKDGVHVDQAGSRAAIELFEEVLEDSPENLRARWLLNLGYMTIGGYPDDVPPRWLIDSDTFESDEEFPRFADTAGERGLDITSMCGGVIIDDFDGDDLLDIVVSDWDPSSRLRLFIGSGRGSFTDSTDAAGLEGISGGLNMMQADYDNDGHVDILVLRGAWLRGRGKHPNSLLRNLGDGRFVDVTFAAGLADENYPTQAAGWADYDNDGDLDLYVGNETSTAIEAPCQLFRNNGDGTFTDVARKAGVANGGFAKGVAWGDYDGDRFPDLYVSNQSGPNRLFRNRGDGTFEDVARELNVTGPSESFATWFWDVDNDGDLDLLVTTYVASLSPTVASYLGEPTDGELIHLYRGDGGESFESVGREMGLNKVSPVMGCNFGDLDNDGFLDFYLGTGYPGYDGLVPNLMYRNRSGKGFADVTSAGGFGHLQKGHGVAFGDLDGDGDQDVFIELGGAFPGDAFRNALFENPGNENHWIVVELAGTRSNRSAIGAQIRCAITEEGQERSIYRHVNSGGSFGANPLRQSIGLGRARKVDVLEIYWPTSELVQVVRDVEVDQRILVVEAADSFEPSRASPTAFTRERADGE